MKFARFAEIPVARSWRLGTEQAALKHSVRSSESAVTSYKVPHEQVMTAIELIGRNVIPVLDRD
jgi:hypothetical protein